MMRETNADGVETVVIDVSFEIYLRTRDEPVNVPTTFEIRKELMGEGSELNDFMGVCLGSILNVIDTAREHRLIFSDRRFNKMVFLTDDIQAVSILAPDEESLFRALETGDSYGN